MGLSAFRALPETDQVLALALEEYEAGLCSGCGLPLDQTMDPDNERAYVAPPPLRCHACTAQARRASEYDEAMQRQALRFPVMLKPPRKKPNRSTQMVGGG